MEPATNLREGSLAGLPRTRQEYRQILAYPHLNQVFKLASQSAGLKFPALTSLNLRAQGQELGATSRDTRKALCE